MDSTVNDNSFLSSNITLDISNRQLHQINTFYREKGINKLFPWQVECLNQPGVLTEGRNLVLSAPTSAGKSLVSEVLMYKCMLERQLKTIIVLPLVAIAEERAQSLKPLFQKLDKRIDSFVGKRNPLGGLGAVDVAVCTIEKANGLFNRLIEDGQLSEIGCVIIDELQTLAEKGRGHLFEILPSKLMYAAKQAQQQEQLSSNALQIVGMSACIGEQDLSIFGSWLNAAQYSTDFRPVPLYEMIVCGNEVILNTQPLATRNQLPWSKPTIPNECYTYIKSTSNHSLIYSAIETVASRHSVLVFCAIKNDTKKLSKEIAGNISHVMTGRYNRYLPALVNLAQVLEPLKEQAKALKRI